MLFLFALKIYRNFVLKTIMEKTIFYFVLLFVIVSCKNNDNKTNDELSVTSIFGSKRLLVKELVEEDGIFYHDGKPFTGIGLVKTHNQDVDGDRSRLCLNWETNYINGIIDGIERAYYENGQVAKEHTYVDKRVVGDFKKWHENGQLKTWHYIPEVLEVRPVAA